MDLFSDKAAHHDGAVNLAPWLLSNKDTESRHVRPFFGECLRLQITYEEVQAHAQLHTCQRIHILRSSHFPSLPGLVSHSKVHSNTLFPGKLGKPPFSHATQIWSHFWASGWLRDWKCPHIHSCVYAYLFSQTITSTKSRALSVHEMFFEVMTFGRRGKRSQRWGGHRWPQANCSAAAEVAQEFHAHNFYSHPSLLFLHFHSCQQLQRQIQRPDFNPSFAWTEMEKAADMADKAGANFCRVL